MVGLKQFVVCCICVIVDDVATLPISYFPVHCLASSKLGYLQMLEIEKLMLLLISVEQEEVLSKAQEVQKSASEKVKDLDYKVKHAKELREKELKEAEAAVGKAKKKAEDSLKKMKEMKQVRIVDC